MSQEENKTKMYQVVLPEDVTLAEIADFLNLMTVTMEVGAGDAIADGFVAKNPRLVVDITVAHKQSQEILGAFDEVDKANMS